jgi:class 3 adenylate cyclase
MGDGFLCFFSGTDHELRAAKAAVLAKQMVGETLQVGLSSGPIYLGAVGHSDYSRPDIMGEVVNIAFLTVSWSEANTQSGLAATSSVVGKISKAFDFGPVVEVSSKGISVRVGVCELCSE